MRVFRGEWLIGALLTLVGAVLLANNFGITDIAVGSLLATWWPALLIFWGAGFLLQRETGQRITGLILLLLGGLVLSRNLGYMDWDLSLLWKSIGPIILILIGLQVLRGGAGNLSGKGNRAVLGGLEKKGQWTVESGSYLALMGGIELDLTSASFPEEEVTLELTAFMGGIEVRVPADIRIRCEGSAVLGGLEMLGKSTGGIISSGSAQQHPEKTTGPSLMIRAHATMGGVEIKPV